MNESQVKQALQTFLAANTAYEWDTSDDSFVNIYEGELWGSDSIVTKTSKQKLSIELSVKLTSVGNLEALDDSLLTTKIAVDTLIKTIKTRNDLIAPLKALKYESWKKEINTIAVSDSQVQYQGQLSIFYSLILQGY